MKIADLIGQKVCVVEVRNNGHHQEVTRWVGKLVSQEGHLLGVEVKHVETENSHYGIHPGTEHIWYNTMASTFNSIRSQS